jgi:hypothetical protein
LEISMVVEGEEDWSRLETQEEDDERELAILVPLSDWAPGYWELCLGIILT